MYVCTYDVHVCMYVRCMYVRTMYVCTYDACMHVWMYVCIHVDRFLPGMQLRPSLASTSSSPVQNFY